jgi:hypothetical protein
LIAGHSRSLLCVATVRRPDDVARVAFGWAAALAIRAASQLATFARDHGALRFDARGLGGLLRRSTMLGAGSVARGLTQSVDVLVLGLFRPADEVARYALAVKLPLFVVSLATLFYMALLPTLARPSQTADGRRIERETLEAVLGAAYRAPSVSGSSPGRSSSSCSAIGFATPRRCSRCSCGASRSARRSGASGRACGCAGPRPTRASRSRRSPRRWSSCSCSRAAPARGASRSGWSSPTSRHS